MVVSGIHEHEQLQQVEQHEVDTEDEDEVDQEHNQQHL